MYYLTFYFITLAKQLNIKDLLDKFTRNQLSRNELDFLYHSVNHELHSSEVKTWLFENWDDIPDKSDNAKSYELFAALKQRILSSEDDSGINPFPEKKGKRKIERFFLPIFKYAALFIAGFFVAWLVVSKLGVNLYSEAIEYNELSIPMGSKSKIILSDGTQVWLNAGSTMKYPSYFKDNVREVSLEGEAFFDVAHDEDRPFKVNTSEIQIKVLGTKFNVKSYPDENIIETTLVSGSIEIESKQTGSRKKHFLKLEPNQKATFSRISHDLSLSDNSQPEKIEPLSIGAIQIDNKVNTEIITCWKDNKLVFNRERFEDIATRLERWYDVQIIIEDSTLKDYRYTGTLEKETLEQALYALRIASPFEYTIDKNNIFIYK